MIDFYADLASSPSIFQTGERNHRPPQQLRIKTAAAARTDGGRYPWWPTLIKENQATRKPLSRRFETAVSEIYIGKYGALRSAVDEIGPIDGLFVAFNLTGVEPHV